MTILPVDKVPQPIGPGVTFVSDPDNSLDAMSTIGRWLCAFFVEQQHAFVFAILDEPVSLDEWEQAVEAVFGDLDKASAALVREHGGREMISLLSLSPAEWGALHAVGLIMKGS